MPPSYRPPQRSRNQWLLSVLLFGLLAALSIAFLLNPQWESEKKFVNAQEVPLSRITQGYAAKEFKEILLRDSTVYATLKDDAVLQSYKEADDTVSQLGWNDPKNPTIVVIENQETRNFLMAVLPDILFFLLVIGGVVWLFRGIARSQSTALSFGKSRARPNKPVIWVHAVSVGETRAAEPLVRLLAARHPECEMLITQMTATGRDTAERVYGGAATLAYLPYDYPFAVRRFLAHFRPRLGVLMETEIWFNLVHACAGSGVPLLLANARMSEKSARGY